MIAKQTLRQMQKKLGLVSESKRLAPMTKAHLTLLRSLQNRSHLRSCNLQHRNFTNSMNYVSKTKYNMISNMNGSNNNKHGNNSKIDIAAHGKRYFASTTKEEDTSNSDNKENDSNQVAPRRPGILIRMVRRLAFGPMIRGILERTGLVVDPLLVPLVSSTVSTALYAFLIITVANKFNIDTTPFVAGFSVAGAAIGFGMKDIAYNYIAGILIATERLCRYGDIVTVAGKYKGKVTSMNLRHMELKLDSESDEYKNETIFIPNSSVFDKPIVVHRRAKRAEFVWSRKGLSKVTKGSDGEEKNESQS